MQAVMLLGPRQMICEELPVPEPGPEEVVLRVGSALTCGTDLKAFLRGHPKMPPPTRFGHEYSGTIAARGADVKNFREGDEVMLAPTGPCGTCFYCQHNQENLCTSLMSTMAFGGYAEYVSLPGRIVRTNMFQKPKSLPFVEAALLEPVSCVVFGLQQVKFTPDDTAVIIGAGGFGLLYLMLLKMLGMERVHIVAKNPDRAKVARELGAHSVIACPAEEAREQVLEVTGGRGADLVIECSGHPSSGPEGIEMLRDGGSYVEMGQFTDASSIETNWHRFCVKDVNILGSWAFTANDIPLAINLLHRVKDRYPWDLIQMEFPFSEEGIYAATQAAMEMRCVKATIIPA